MVRCPYNQGPGNGRQKPHKQTEVKIGKQGTQSAPQVGAAGKHWHHGGADGAICTPGQGKTDVTRRQPVVSHPQGLEEAHSK